MEAGYSPSGKFAFQMGGTAQQTSYDEPQEIFAPEDNDGVAISVDEFVRTPNLYGYFTTFYNVTDAFKIDLTGTYTGPMIVPRVVGANGSPDLLHSQSFLDVNLKLSYDFDVADDFHIELSGGAATSSIVFNRNLIPGPNGTLISFMDQPHLVHSFCQSKSGIFIDGKIIHYYMDNGPFTIPVYTLERAGIGPLAQF